MRTRHSNLLAMAHFLKTRTEPVLVCCLFFCRFCVSDPADWRLQYYKPWELRPEDEDTIRDQVEEAEATISREVADFEAHHLPEEEDSRAQEESRQEEPQEQAPAPEADPKESQDTANEASDTVGADNNLDRSSEVARTDGTPTNDHHAAAPDQTDVHRGADDDGGEVVEDQEDTVIY